MQYIKKYPQGFVLGIMLSLIDVEKGFEWHDQLWKHWFIIILMLPVIFYILSDFVKDFEQVRVFSKESIGMIVFACLGILSCLFIQITLGLFDF